MSRGSRIGHLTASALVMDEHRTRVLLTLHPKVGRWLQLGGHVEPGDASLREAARRETIEEGGIADVTISEDRCASTGIRFPVAVRRASTSTCSTSPSCRPTRRRS